jgi:phospholipid transport system substrate-binding protein
MRDPAPIDHGGRRPLTLETLMRTLSSGVALAFVLTLLTVDGASAGPPTDQLRSSVDGVLKTLSDPEMKNEAKTAERRRLIRAAASEIFDFPEISRRSLAVHWQARTPAERQQFVALFGDLLEHSYISKIEAYSGEKILYLGETIDGNQAIVRTRIVGKQGAEIPVDYRMLVESGRWRAYDVSIEGVSLVANYRSQFNSIIQRSGYPDLVGKLKARQDERPGPREVGREDKGAGRGGSSSTSLPQSP